MLERKERKRNNERNKKEQERGMREAIRGEECERGGERGMKKKKEKREVE